MTLTARYINKMQTNILIKTVKYNYKSYEKQIANTFNYCNYLNGTQQRNQQKRKQDTKRPKREQLLRKKEYLCALMAMVQWNPVNTTTFGPWKFGRISGVGSNYDAKCF